MLQPQSGSGARERLNCPLAAAPYSRPVLALLGPTTLALVKRGFVVLRPAGLVIRVRRLTRRSRSPLLEGRGTSAADAHRVPVRLEPKPRYKNSAAKGPVQGCLSCQRVPTCPIPQTRRPPRRSRLGCLGVEWMADGRRLARRWDVKAPHWALGGRHTGDLTRGDVDPALLGAGSWSHLPARGDPAYSRRWSVRASKRGVYRERLGAGWGKLDPKLLFYSLV